MAGEEAERERSPQPAVNNFVAAKNSRPVSDGDDLEFSLSVYWFSAPAGQAC